MTVAMFAAKPDESAKIHSSMRSEWQQVFFVAEDER